MIETITVTCPECKVILVIDKKTGNIIEKRDPILTESTGDRFKDAYIKVKESGKRAQEKFNQAQEKRKERLQNVDKIFKDSLKNIQEKGEMEEKPPSPYDLE
jgi:hypothetical protein